MKVIVLCGIFFIFAKDGKGDSVGCKTLVVGDSSRPSVGYFIPGPIIKTVTMDPMYRCPIHVDRTNGLDGFGGAKWSDYTFSVSQANDQVVVTQVDPDGSFKGEPWKFDLRFECCKVRPAFCPLKCGTCQECKQWCSPQDWCGDSDAHKGGKYLKHMATDCRDCENVGPPSYVESKGACRGGTSPGGNAGLVYHKNRDCRHRCDIDPSCTGYVMPNSYVDWRYWRQFPNWCETYTSLGVTGDGSSNKHGYKCHAKIPDEKNDAYISNIDPKDGLLNKGKDCWSHCNGSQGPCLWCGNFGYCCTQKPGWTDVSNGCDGSIGGQTGHECSLRTESESKSTISKPNPEDGLLNKGEDCWYHCSSKQGPCSWCGSGGYCCTRKSGWTDVSNGCDGTFGGQTRHECSKPI